MQAYNLHSRDIANVCKLKAGLELAGDVQFMHVQ